MTTLIKQFQRAADADLKKLKFPYLGQPKYDGVRGGNLWGRMLARSMRPFTNKHTGEFFSQHPFLGLDGELCAGPEDSQSLCRDTTSAVGTITGQPWLMWHVFDYLTPEVVEWTYERRYQKLRERVNYVKETNPMLGAHLTVMPAVWIEDLEDLMGFIEINSAKGYEGTIIRSVHGLHKNGYSSPTHNGLLRIKPFIEVDALVLKIYEGQTNGNEAELDYMGNTKRSTHAANMSPNGMVGAMDAQLLEHAIHPFTREVVHKAGDVVRFGAGRMTHAERLHFFIHQAQFLGQRMKGKIFAHGTKDKARFPTYQCLRLKEDV